MASAWGRVSMAAVMAVGVAGYGAVAAPGCSSSSGSQATPDASTPTTDGATCDFHLPSGFTQVTSSTSDATFGSQVSMALDENDDPMFAYLVFASGSDATLNFVRWDECKGTFTAPIVIDDVGVLSNDTGERQVSIAYDPSNKAIAIAYQKVVPDPGKNDAEVIWLATRPASASTFATQQISEGENGDIAEASTPSIAMHAGNTWVAYAQENYLCCASCGSCSALWFLSSTATAPADDAAPANAGPLFFNRSTVQFGGDVAGARFDSVSLAIDGNGVPAVAFYQPPPTAYNTTLLYWHSDQPAAVAVTDSNNIQNDAVDVTLAFEGTRPRVAGHLVAVDSAPYDLTYVASDDGVTWGAPVRLPEDGDQATAYTSALAVDGTGKVAVAADSNSGAGSNKCNNPYLAQSTDDGVTFSACGADTAKAHTYNVGAANAKYGSSRLKGTLVLGFQNSNIQGETAGVVYWQSP